MQCSFHINFLIVNTRHVEMQRDVLFSMIIITFSGFWGLQSFLCKLNSIKMLVINDCQIKGWYKILLFSGVETQINIQFNKNILSLILTYFKYFSYEYIKQPMDIFTALHFLFIIITIKHIYLSQHYYHINKHNFKGSC